MKKTNYSYVGISFIILVFGIIFIPRIIERFQSGDIARNKRMSKENVEDKQRVDTSEKLMFLEINGEPKKVPNFSFTNQDGKTVSNKDYEGKVYVVEFFFTTCPTICPKMNANLIQIQNTFTDNKDFGVASFTINPNNDTPEVLKAYADKYGVTNSNWNMMTGDKDAIYELANLGFNIYAGENPEAEEGFEHSGNFALIDKNGFIRSRKVQGNPVIFYNGIISEEEGVDDEGMEQQITMLKEDIKKLLDE